MAPKQVYGKRSKAASSFVISTNFSWSSPAKDDSRDSELRPPVDRQNQIEITMTAEQTTMSVAHDEKESSAHHCHRRPLVPKDSNVRPPTAAFLEQKTMPNLKRKIFAAKLEPQGTPGRPGKHSSSKDAMPSPPRSERQDAPADRAEAMPESCENHYLQPLLDLCSDTSTHPSLSTYVSWSETLEPYFSIVKIAEASYGEVYRLCLKQPHPSFKASDESVLKILPLRPPPSTKKKSNAQRKREEQMSDVISVASEVKLLQRMSPIPGFTNFRGILVLKGRPSEVFVDAWKDFNRAQPKGAKSQFLDPSKKASYSHEQLWAVIEMQDAGVDLEHVEFRTVWEVWDVFWGVALALAKGEEEAKFEHRDLHLGNICVQSRRRDEKVGETRIRNVKGRRIGFTGLETTLIDYTLSRAEMADEDDIAFLDLNQLEWLFEQDASDEYQYEIYRLMRKAVDEGSLGGLDDMSDLARALDPTTAATKFGRDIWRDFSPLTNIIWLHYVLGKLLTPLEGVKEDDDCIVHRLGAGGDLQYAQMTAKRLDEALRQLEAVLSVESLGLADAITSARDLVGIALEEAWLAEADVVEATGGVISPRKLSSRGVKTNGKS